MKAYLHFLNHNFRNSTTALEMYGKESLYVLWSYISSYNILRLVTQPRVVNSALVAIIIPLFIFN